MCSNDTNANCLLSAQTVLPSAMVPQKVSQYHDALCLRMLACNDGACTECDHNQCNTNTFERIPQP